MRANATLLFTDAFPVHNPDQNNKNIDEAIQKQLDTAMVRTFKTMQQLFELEKEKNLIKILIKNHLSIILRHFSKTIIPLCAPMPPWESVRS